MPPSVLTVGHSNHPPERFLALLARHGVEALVDMPSGELRPHKMGHDALLIMAGTTQRFRKYEVPKTTKNVGERINLTLRFMGGV